MAEWLKAAVLKTVERKFRGFESYSLRHYLNGIIWRDGRVGRRRSPAKRVYWETGIEGSNPSLSAIFKSKRPEKVRLVKVPMRKASKVLTIALMMAVALAGCKKKEEPQQAEMMPPHGMTGEKHESVVVVPDSVKGKWKAVKISVLDKGAQKSAEYEIIIGSEVAVPESDLVIKVDNFLPDFIMDGPVRTSASGEPKKPAAQIRITEAGKEVFKGWLFYNLPSPHDFQHPKYAVSMAGFIPAGK